MSDGIQKLGMPKWGLSMTEGRLVEWLVEEGAEVAVGDEVAEVETDKLNGAVECPVAGVLRRRVASAGETIPVGGLLAVVAAPDVSLPASDSVEAPAPGSDRDSHGCIPSAGYSWCARTNQCERPWELAKANGFENTREAFEKFCGVLAK